MRPPSPSIPEKDFFFAALDQNARLDGRGFLEARPLELSFGAELGHVECSLGKTRYVPEPPYILTHLRNDGARKKKKKNSVLAHVDAKMVRPEPQRPFEGLISIHCELSPMAGAEYEPGRSVVPTPPHPLRLSPDPLADQAKKKRRSRAISTRSSDAATRSTARHSAFSQASASGTCVSPYTFSLQPPLPLLPTLPQQQGAAGDYWTARAWRAPRRCVTSGGRRWRCTARAR